MSIEGTKRDATRLLLIDANSDRRASLAAVLQRRGFGSVLGCEGVDDALEASGAWAPDLVLVDLDTLEDSDADLTRLAPIAPGALIGLSPAEGARGRLTRADTRLTEFLIRPFGLEELGLRIDAVLSAVRERRRLVTLGSGSPDGSDTVLDPVQEGLDILAAVADYHDDDTHRHAQRVGIAAVEIARAMDLPPTYVTMLRNAAPLHDIGKVGISRRILLKPGRLTSNEWLHMTAHVQIGAQILASARGPVFQMAAEIARTHHERWDGTGYSAGLRGEQIPLSGRIVAVADTWDTLLSDRPYRPAWTPDRAWNEILAGSESSFDPDVVSAFAALDESLLTGNRRAAAIPSAPALSVPA